MRHGAPRLDRVRGWAFRTQTSYRRNVRPRLKSVGWTCLLYPPCSMPSLLPDGIMFTQLDDSRIVGNPETMLRPFAIRSGRNPQTLARPI
jgi:hypothetical protein